jgi:hypothetical protein
MLRHLSDTSFSVFKLKEGKPQSISVKEIDTLTKRKDLTSVSVAAYFGKVSSPTKPKRKSASEVSESSLILFSSIDFLFRS